MKRFTRISEFSKLSSEEDEIASKSVSLNNKANNDTIKIIDRSLL